MTELVRRSGTKVICEVHCKEAKLAVFEGKVIVCCPHLPPQILVDGKLQELKLA